MQSLLELRDAELLRPEYLWLLAPFVALALYSIVRGREKLLVTLARTLLVSLVLFALAQPVRKQVRTESELPVVFDASASILPEAKQALLGALRPYLASGVPIRLYPFARSVSSESIEIGTTADLDEVIDGLEATTRSADSGDTNIALAITTAAYRSPSSPLLLLSDGFETSGDARQAASLASTRGVSVFPVVTAPELFSERGLSISALDAPLTVHAGDLAEVRMSLKNSLSDGPRAGTLELFADDKKLFSQNVSVGPMSEKTFFVKTGALEGGTHRLRAQVTVDGTSGAKAKREVHRWISAKTRSKILLISGSEGDRRVLRQLLAHKGYSVEDLVADGNAEIPTTFTAYSSVIMNNVSERQLPRAFLPSLREHVRGGGGLLLIGGDRSYGLGGYIDTPLEEISPLKFVPPKTTQRRLNSGVILVIDKSKSMAQEGKIDAAKGAALLSIGSMNKEDYVGVIGFDSGPFVIIRLGPVPEIQTIAERRLQNLTAAGRTELLPALAAARQSLSGAPVSRRHVIVLTDGKVPSRGDEYIQEVGRLRSAGISVSTVGLGADADVPFLQMVASSGKGAFYHTLDPRRLPEIFMHDIKVTTGEKTMKEREEYPVAIGISGLQSTTVERFPPVRGFVETLPKRGANLELITEAEGAVHPILASWSFGGGKVIAFTSDANGRWSLNWLTWAGFAKFWGEVVELVEKGPQTKSEDLDFDLRYSINRNALRLDLTVFDPKLGSGSTPKTTASILAPGGERKQLVLGSEKKGRFVAALDNARAGDYQLEFTYGTVKFPPVMLTLPASAFGEVAGRGLDLDNLSQIARLSGGRVNPSPTELATFSRQSEQVEYLYPPLMSLALLTLLVGVFIRQGGILSLLALQFARLIPRRNIPLRNIPGRGAVQNAVRGGRAR